MTPDLSQANSEKKPKAELRGGKWSNNNNNLEKNQGLKELQSRKI